MAKYQSLRVDTGELSETSGALQLIAMDFSGGDAVVHHLVDAVGNGHGTGDLRHEIKGFSSSWDARRERMRERIDDLRGITAMVAREFESMDARLAEQISVKPASGASQGSHYTPGGGN